MTPPPSFVQDGRLDREPLVAELRRFLDLFLRETRLELSYAVETPAPVPDEIEHPEVIVTFRGYDQDLLLERNAELLHAIEYIALRWLRLEPKYHDRVRLDCGDYRALRLEELKLSARVAAERVRETRAAFHFNPMPARERRVIHLAVQDAPGVRSTSEGAGPERHVVLYPADQKN